MSDFSEFALQNWLLFLAFFAILGLLVGSELLRRMRGVSAIDAAGALRLMNDRDAAVVDIREAAQYKEGHIPQARHIPSSALRERVEELAKLKERPVIVYCQTGSASQAASAVLKKNGFAEVYSLSGGLAGWLDAHLPVSRKKS